MEREKNVHEINQPMTSEPAGANKTTIQSGNSTKTCSIEHSIYTNDKVSIPTKEQLEK